jgi:hypothetical protein
MRGEGTWASVRRVMASIMAGFSCTKPFHHRGHRGHRVKPESQGSGGDRGSGAVSLSGLRGRLSIPLITKIDHLSDVVLHMGRALHDNIETIERIGGNAGIISGPVLRQLRVDGSDDHGDGIGEAPKSLIFRWRIRIVEFARSVANVASVRDLRADVVIQIAREMEHKVAEAVSEGEGLLPELVFSQGGS